MQGRFAFVVAVLALSALPAWAQGPSITLAWDPPLEGAVAGYRVYVGTRSGVYSESYDVGSATLFTYDNATAGRRYYFAVSAYDASGNRSGYSNEIAFTAASGAPAANFSASPTSGAAPLAVQFTSLSTGTIGTYAWSFGDGTTSSAHSTYL